MKHYLLSPEGLKRITSQDVESWRLQGGFMKAEGPIMIPVALGAPDASCIESLLKKSENFVYWLTPDFRVALTTKEGVGWKLRFEVRGQGKDGKAIAQMIRVDGKVRADGVIQVIADVFTSLGKQHGAFSEVPPDAPAIPNESAQQIDDSVPGPLAAAVS